MGIHDERKGEKVMMRDVIMIGIGITVGVVGSWFHSWLDQYLVTQKE